MKFCYIIIFSTIILSVKSQNTYNIFIDDTLPKNTYDFIYNASNNTAILLVASYINATYRGIELVKINTLTGNEINRKQFWDTTMSIYEAPNDGILKTYDNNIIVLTVTPLPNNYYISLTKFDLNFDTIWSQNHIIGDTLQTIAYDIIETADSGYAICGSSSYLSGISLKPDAFLLKTDSLGNQEWIQTYGYNNGDGARNVIQTANGDFIIGGYSRAYDAYRDDWYIIRTDSAGNKIWDWVIQNPNMHDYGGVLDLIQTQDGNFIAVGRKTYYDDAAYYIKPDARLIKFDINKNIIKDTTYLETFDNTNWPDCKTYSYFNRIIETPDGSLYALITIRPLPQLEMLRTMLYKLKPNGELIWKREIHATPYGDAFEYLYDIAQTNDNGFIMSGYVHGQGLDNFQPPAQLIWLVKTDSLGCDGFGSCDTNLRFEFVNFKDTLIKTENYDLGFKITGGNYDTIYDVNIGIWTTDEYLIETNYDNIIMDSINYFTINYDTLSALATNVFDSIFVAYYYSHGDSTSGPSYWYTERYLYKIMFIDEISVEEISDIKAKIKIYPNPTTGKIKVEADGIERIELMDLQGRTVLSQNTKDKDQKYDLDLSSQAKGIYFIKVTTAKGVAVEKVIKE